MKEKHLANGAATGVGVQTVASLDTTILKDLRNIVAHCAATRYDSGNPREPGWLVVKTIGSIWAVTLKDPDSCLQVSAVGLTVDEALCTADVLLAADEAPWELDRYLANRPGRKRK